MPRVSSVRCLRQTGGECHRHVGHDDGFPTEAGVSAKGAGRALAEGAQQKERRRHVGGGHCQNGPEPLQASGAGRRGRRFSCHELAGHGEGVGIHRGVSTWFYCPMCVCMVTRIARVRINWVRLRILLVVS